MKDTVNSHIVKLNIETISAEILPLNFEAPYQHAVRNLFREMYSRGTASKALVAYDETFRNVASTYLASRGPGSWAPKGALPLFDFLNEQFSLSAIQKGRAFISI